MTYALYIASAFGAAGLIMMMPRQGFNPRPIGALLGAIALGGLWLYLSNLMLNRETGLPGAAFAYHYVFSAIAIGAATRVITHTKPVYAALWFVMVVMATSGLFLTLDAEFIAAAMIIIYGGAILVTYVFVIMLASESSGANDGKPAPEYERIAREPVAAVIAGFILLASLLTVYFDRPMLPNPAAARTPDVSVITLDLPNRPANRMKDEMIKAGKAAPQSLIDDTIRLDNVEHVGLDLFRQHPLGLELAGVILLVSLVGAVIIARKHVEPQAAES